MRDTTLLRNMLSGELLTGVLNDNDSMDSLKFEEKIRSSTSSKKMFTRRVVILKRVEDLQLGVESYQKKLNITRPETFMSDISKRTPYTAYNNPQDIIYLDKYKRNRLMYSDELYKFCDVTLTSVRTVLHDITSNPMMGYLPKRRWSNLDRKRSRIMIKAIDRQLFERRLMRNLEKFVGGRDYGEDLRLLERTYFILLHFSRHGPNDAMRNPPQPLKVIKTLVSNLTDITLISIDFLTTRLLILKRRQSAPTSNY
ncbi:hypothetical protein Tco_0773699 [Tanacetum coccineum]|uniref:Ribosomal protein S4 n=1 Tax=Tanacetum coccineum TaxID=301880 RepID=A0ABQ4ZLF9_9ASTR